MLEFCSHRLLERLLPIYPSVWTHPLWVLKFLTNHGRVSSYRGAYAMVSNTGKVWRHSNTLKKLKLPYGQQAAAVAVNDILTGILTCCGQVYTVLHTQSEVKYLRSHVVQIAANRESLTSLVENGHVVTCKWSRVRFWEISGELLPLECHELTLKAPVVIDIGTNWLRGECYCLTVDGVAYSLSDVPYQQNPIHLKGVVGLFAFDDDPGVLFNDGGVDWLNIGYKPRTGFGSLSFVDDGGIRDEYPRTGIIAGGSGITMDERGSVWTRYGKQVPLGNGLLDRGRRLFL